MGIYTNYTGGFANGGRYTDVEPFVGENFNYHELGIIAASEIAYNHNAFMKSIALSELAAVEATGSTDVLYEAVNIKSIFDKIKMFFKKIIEKIHKIFHTFIAKMSSWFGNNKKFADKYANEIQKGWNNVKSDWNFKGFDYSKALAAQANSKDLVATSNTAKDTIKGLLNGDLEAYVKGAGKEEKEEEEKEADGTPKKNPDGTPKMKKTLTTKDITADLATYREKLDDIKNGIRKDVVDSIAKGTIPTSYDIKVNASGGYDQTEFTNELYKALRNDQDAKVDMDKNAIETAYTSITNLINYIRDFDKSKENLEKSEKNITDGIAGLIKKMDTEENKLLKADRDNGTNTNEAIVQASTFYQTIWGFISETMTQAFTAVIQANKKACTQAKEIAVKVIGQSKKMTESYDYYSNSSYDSGDFISSVKLI